MHSRVPRSGGLHLARVGLFRDRSEVTERVGLGGSFYILLIALIARASHSLNDISMPVIRPQANQTLATWSHLRSITSFTEGAVGGGRLDRFILKMMPRVSVRLRAWL